LLSNAIVEALRPPIEPMLAKLESELPPEGGVLYEPKWEKAGRVNAALRREADEAARGLLLQGRRDYV
jgi:hypothetical protein